ncbi:Cupredoxin superfamily protein, partial [Thalictrum thalictroides]
MSKCKSKCYYYYLLFILVVVVVSTTTSTNARAGETHLVGGDQGWTQFPNYTAWALHNTFQVGDTLVFSYAQQLHNVVQVNQTAYHQCLRDPNLGMLQSGNDSVILQQAGLI